MSTFQQLNIYEVNLRQYTPEGTITAFIQHLPRLHDMGVEVLWIMPIHPIGVLNRKGILGSYYSVKDFYDVNPEFGTKEDFKILVERVHGYGMKIIIDWVANHAAWDNNWTTTNPEFFERNDAGNFKSPFDWSDVIQIDHSSKTEQAAMLNAMKYWITEFDIDGFRADLAHLTPLPFWINARTSLNTIKKDLLWLAETEETNYYEAFDILYAWKWMHATETFFKENKDINSLISLLQTQQQDIPKDAWQLYFTSNHDENSWNGTEYEKYGIYAKALAVFNYTYCNSVPLIYSGQELPNYKRLAFFEKDIIEWKENIELHAFYKTLITFHKNNFTAGELRFLPSQKNMLAFIRQKEEKAILVFLNLDKEKRRLDFPDTGINGNYKNIFTGEMVFISENITVELEAGGFLLFFSN
ncbi:MAG: alpha-amylase family glycosyl hydrolase [Ferruginibacter sp.]